MKYAGSTLAANIFLCDTTGMIDATLLSARAYIQAGGSKERLAEASDLHRNTLIGMERADWSPTLRTVRKLAVGVAAIKREGMGA